MKVIWTSFALESLHKIYNYYKVNVNIRVANKIKKEVFNATKQLRTEPNSGTKELLLELINEGHRYLVSGNYKIIYKISNKNIYITDVFDTRQNPEKLIDNADFTFNEPQPEYQNI